MMRGWIRRFTGMVAPRSLRLQLLSRSLLILVAMLAVIGIFQYVFLQQFLYQNKADSIHGLIRTVPPGVWELFGDNARRGGGNRPLLFFPNSSVAFFDLDGTLQVLSKDPDSGSVPQFPEAHYREVLERPRGSDPLYTVVKDDAGIQQLAVFEPVYVRDRLIGAAQVTTQTRPFRDELAVQLLLFIALSGAALLIGFLAFMPLIRRTLNPLSSMVAQVEQINAGNLNERLPAGLGQAEVDRLAVSFNRMLERLEASFEAEREAKEQMRRFIADASHELRTPLTSIHGFLEVLLRGAAGNPEQLEKALRSMHNESGRLSKLVRDLLLLARLDRSPETKMAEGSLGDLVRDMEPQLRLLAGERSVNIAISPALPPGRFDADKMKQVLLNLFQNAVQHTDPKIGHIAVSVSPAPGGIELAVKDNGTGIPAGHLPHLFERFYRIDASRSRLYGGAGLGLSITQSIVELHGGTIRAESAAGAGSIFRVHLPAPDPDSAP